jgi:hypothetical protein
MLLLRIPLGAIVWFGIWLSVISFITISTGKSVVEFSDDANLQGFLWLIPWPVFILLINLYGSQIAEAELPYRRAMSSYFAYGNAESRIGRFAIAATGDNYYALAREIGEALKHVEEQYGESKLTKEQLTAALDLAYGHTFRRHGADVESTLAFYSAKLLAHKVHGTEKEAMLAIIEICAPNIPLLVRGGLVSEETAANIRQVINSQPAATKH